MGYIAAIATVAIIAALQAWYAWLDHRYPITKEQP